MSPAKKQQLNDAKMKKLALAIVATSAMGAMSSTQAATMCVFDLLGASGEAYQQMKG